MKIEDLRRVLDRALKEEASWKGAEGSRDAKALDALLTESSALSIEEFCTQARAGLKKRKASKAAASFNELAVVRYVNELESTRSESLVFEKVVTRMKGDKAVKIPEAREIAKRFLGGSQTYKSKADAFKSILQRQITDVRAAGKIGRIADIF